MIIPGLEGLMWMLNKPHNFISTINIQYSLWDTAQLQDGNGMVVLYLHKLSVFFGSINMAILKNVFQIYMYGLIRL